MIRKIIGKEIREHILSLRFMLSLLLTISLFAANGFIFARRYEKQLAQYSKKTNKDLEGFRGQSGRLFQLAFYRHEVYAKPGVLTCCAEGYERALPNCVRFNGFTSDLPEIRDQGNFSLPHFSDIDWAFITAMILSFVALVFTYDSICGEKETGTLALMLSGAVPRSAALLAKYVATMVTLGIPLGIGLLVNLLIIVSSRNVAFESGEWWKILALVLLSFLCLSVFVLLGLLVSSRTAHPANSMVILLLVWVAIVVLTPSVGRIISDVSARGTTQVDLRRKLEEASKQIDERAEAGAFGERPGSMSPNLSDPMNNPPARARWMIAKTDARNQVRQEHHRKLLAQVSAGWNLTCFSPTVVYRRAAETIAGTGVNHCASLRRQVQRYQDELLQYVRDEDSRDPNSLHLLFDEYGCAESWKTISHRPVDFQTVPKFQERALALGASVRLAIWDVGLLTLFNLAFFAAAWASLARYDVR
ncbi:MAG: ABC transporter permease subunit [Sedimentisphaerales bacterium]|nr:ABC transporter permease subunit [Sedimentisphaerales bacterium]